MAPLEASAEVQVEDNGPRGTASDSDNDCDLLDIVDEYETPGRHVEVMKRERAPSQRLLLLNRLSIDHETNRLRMASSLV